MPDPTRAVIEAAALFVAVRQREQVGSDVDGDEADAYDALESAVDALASTPPPEPLPLAAYELNVRAVLADGNAADYRCRARRHSEDGDPVALEECNDLAARYEETARQCREAARRLSCRA